MSLEIPWYAKSPSPWTITIWVILTLWASRILLKRVHYRRPRLAWLLAVADAAMILGFVQVFADLLWCVVCGLRFGSSFPFYPDVYGLLLAAARDGVAMIFFFLLIGSYFGQYVRANALTYAAVLGYVIFLAVWFGLSSDPSFTDWNFAIKHGYPASRVLVDFLISHVLGRIFAVVMFWSLFRKQASV